MSERMSDQEFDRLAGLARPQYMAGQLSDSAARDVIAEARRARKAEETADWIKSRAEEPEAKKAFAKGPKS